MAPGPDPLADWPDGTQVVVLAGSVHQGRTGTVQRLRQGNGESSKFMPNCLRVVFDAPVEGGSAMSYLRPRLLQVVGPAA